MACCLTALNHYLNQGWHMIIEVLYHLHEEMPMMSVRIWYKTTHLKLRPYLSAELSSSIKHPDPGVRALVSRAYAGHGLGRESCDSYDGRWGKQLLIAAVGFFSCFLIGRRDKANPFDIRFRQHEYSQSCCSVSGALLVTFSWNANVPHLC